MTSIKDSNCRESVQYGDALPTVVSQIADCKFQLFSFCIQCCQRRLLCAFMGTNCTHIHRVVFAGGWAVIVRNQFLFFQITVSVHLCMTLAKCFVFAGQMALV
jgi:hypothetical protein